MKNVFKSAVVVSALMTGVAEAGTVYRYLAPGHMTGVTIARYAVDTDNDGDIDIWTANWSQRQGHTFGGSYNSVTQLTTAIAPVDHEEIARLEAARVAAEEAARIAAEEAEAARVAAEEEARLDAEAASSAAYLDFVTYDADTNEYTITFADDTTLTLTREEGNDPARQQEVLERQLAAEAAIAAEAERATVEEAVEEVVEEVEEATEEVEEVEEATEEVEEVVDTSEAEAEARRLAAEATRIARIQAQIKLENEVSSDLKGPELTAVSKNGTRFYIQPDAGGFSVSKEFDFDQFVVAPKAGIIGLGQGYIGTTAEADIAYKAGDFRFGYNTGTHFSVRGDDVSVNGQTDQAAFVEYNRGIYSARVDTNGRATVGFKINF